MCRGGSGRRVDGLRVRKAVSRRSGRAIVRARIHGRPVFPCHMLFQRNCGIHPDMFDIQRDTDAGCRAVDVFAEAFAKTDHLMFGLEGQNAAMLRALDALGNCFGFKRLAVEPPTEADVTAFVELVKLLKPYISNTTWSCAESWSEVVRAWPHTESGFRRLGRQYRLSLLWLRHCDHLRPRLWSSFWTTKGFLVTGIVVDDNLKELFRRMCLGGTGRGTALSKARVSNIFPIITSFLTGPRNSYFISNTSLLKPEAPWQTKGEHIHEENKNVVAVSRPMFRQHRRKPRKAVDREISVDTHRTQGHQCFLGECSD